MWSGRFREPLEPGFEAWQRSLPLTGGCCLQEIAASKAHARMIARLACSRRRSLTTTLHGLDAIIPRARKRATDSAARSGLTRRASLVSAVGAWRRASWHRRPRTSIISSSSSSPRRSATLALKLHTGRSRNEQIATDLRLYVREQIELTVERPCSVGRGAGRAGAQRPAMP